MLATAGNVVFYGTLDRKFKVVDAASGKLVFEKQLECGVVGNPVAYTAPDGKQRVAVYTGVGWLAGGLAGGTCPSGGSSSEDSPSTQSGRSAGVRTPLAAAAAGVNSGMLHVFKLP